MDTPMQELLRKQEEGWRMMGAEPVYERGTVRLRQYRKSFGPEVEVKIRDAETGIKTPFLLRSGRPLMASEVLPERADLALNEDGTLLPQHEFAQRYEHYVDAFVLAEGSDPRLEPVPDVVKYVNAKPDVHGESGGYVEIDYDPQFDKPFKPQHFYGPDGETEEEYLANKAKADKVDDALAQLAQGQEMIAKLLAMQGGADTGEVVPVTQEAIEAAHKEIVTDQDEAAAEPDGIGGSGVSVDEASMANADPGMAQMPCGKWKKAAYRRQHMRKCGQDICQKTYEAESSGGDEDQAA